MAVNGIVKNVEHVMHVAQQEIAIHAVYYVVTRVIIVIIMHAWIHLQKENLNNHGDVDIVKKFMLKKHPLAPRRKLVKLERRSKFLFFVMGSNSIF